MARKGKGYQGLRRSFTDEQSNRRFESNLDRLSDLCADYDAGRISYALPISVEIQKILTEGGTDSTRRRGEVKFPGPDSIDEASNLAAFHALTIARIGSEHGNPEGRFIHAFEGAPASVKWQKFKHWWNETIFRKSAAMPGTPAGMIPVNGAPSVPFEDRERLNRRELIKFLRNHAGAHDAGDYPVILDEIDGPQSWGGFGVFDEATGMEYSTSDGTLHWTAGQLAAAARQIAEEVLIAFNRREISQS